MKLLNNDETFEIVYDGRDYVVPEGEFEVGSAHLGTFIHEIAIKWEKDVVILNDGGANEIRQEIKPKEEKIELKEVKKEEPKKEEPKKEEPKKEEPKKEEPKKEVKKGRPAKK